MINARDDYTSGRTRFNHLVATGGRRDEEAAGLFNT